MKKARYPSLFVLFLVLFALFFVMNIGAGSVSISFFEVCKIIYQHLTDSTHAAIIWKIRLPRTLAAGLCGAYLAGAGLLLQVFFRNPIVGPYILGISSGAALMVALVMLAGLSVGFLGIHPFFISLAAFAGAMVVMLIIISVAPRVKNIVTLLIIGLMLGYLCHAVTSILVAFAEERKLKGFVLWELGSFSGFCWDEVYLVVVMGGLFMLGAYLLCKPLNAFLLGEDYAKSMGVNILAFRIMIVVFSSALAGMVTAFAGPVAFIGLAVPHMARLVFGTSDNRILIPGAALIGGVVTILCDLVARLLFSPVELPISAITAFFGAPIVISFLLKRRTAV